MDLYTLDPATFRREALIENFESAIWTDRYAQYGDLSMVVEPTINMMSRLKPGTLVGFDQSRRIMRVVSSYRSQNSDGKISLKVDGRSLETILDDRVARIALNNTTWNLTGTIGQIITSMVSQICGAASVISPADTIPSLTVTDSSGATAILKVEIKLGTVYERVKELCDSYDLGFRLTQVQPNSTALNFSVYSGTNRTVAWGVEFSSNLENLQETSSLVSNDGYKNVAYVISVNGSRIVNASGGFSSNGFTRRVLPVDATDITLPAGTALNDALDLRGRQALSDHRASKLFDGSIGSNYPYKFNTDYFLGDLVPLIDDDNSRQIMRVTEYIWSIDKEGVKAYPTLSVPGGV